MAGVLWLRYRPEHDVKLLTHGPDPCCVSFSVMELKFAEYQGFCTTLWYVAFTDIENMIGDAGAACSLTRNMEPPFQVRVAAFTGSEHLYEDAQRIQRTVDVAARIRCVRQSRRSPMKMRISQRCAQHSSNGRRMRKQL